MDRIQPAEYYSKRGARWTEEETQHLQAHYKNNNVIPLSNELKRTPGQILFHLNQLEMITKDQYQKEFSEYKKTELFKEISKGSKRKFGKKREEAKEEDSSQVEELLEALREDLKAQREDLKAQREELNAQQLYLREQREELKAERELLSEQMRYQKEIFQQNLQALQKDIKEVLRLMNMVYDFEASEE